MDIHTTKKEAAILKIIAEGAWKLDIPCYLIGGFVRDKLLKRDTKDIDIMCVGDGIELAQQVAPKFRNSPQVSYFKNFGTAQIRTDELEM